jgi:hypothetical protein
MRPLRSSVATVAATNVKWKEDVKWLQTRSVPGLLPTESMHIVILSTHHFMFVLYNSLVDQIVAEEVRLCNRPAS